jgi:hypothetical protein
VHGGRDRPRWPRRPRLVAPTAFRPASLLAPIKGAWRTPLILGDKHRVAAKCSACRERITESGSIYPQKSPIFRGRSTNVYQPSGRRTTARGLYAAQWVRKWRRIAARWRRRRARRRRSPRAVASGGRPRSTRKSVAERASAQGRHAGARPAARGARLRLVCVQPVALAGDGGRHRGGPVDRGPRAFSGRHRSLPSCARYRFDEMPTTAYTSTMGMPGIETRVGGPLHHLRREGRLAERAEQAVWHAPRSGIR